MIKSPKYSIKSQNGSFRWPSLLVTLAFVYQHSQLLRFRRFFKIHIIFQEEGWKLNRNHYYQEGWLSTANLRGVVGVTYTTSHCGIDGSSQLVPPSRTNYNLRGHRAEVGIIFTLIKTVFPVINSSLFT